MRLEWCGIALACGVACGNVERNASGTASESPGTMGSGAAGAGATPGTGGTSASAVGSGGAGGAAGGSAGAGATVADVTYPTPLDVSIDCDGCEDLSYQGFRYGAWVPKLAWAGARLLVVRAASLNYQVDLLELRPELRTIWSHGVQFHSSTQLLEDEGQAVVVDSYQEDRLEVFAESLDFEPLSPPVEARSTPGRVVEGELHLLSGTVEGSIQYQKGPLAGPFEIVRQFDAFAMLPAQGPLLPIARTNRVDSATVLLSVNVDDEELALEVPWMTSLSALVSEGDLLALGQRSLHAATLWWGDQERQLGGPAPDSSRCGGRSTANAPEVCPQSSRDLGERTQVLLAAQLFLDESEEAWLAYVLADVSERCSWVNAGGCFESLPCDCAEEVEASASATELVVERATDPNRSLRVPLPTFTGRLHLVQVAARTDDGVISVAVVDADAYESNVYVLRFFVPE